MPADILIIKKRGQKIGIKITKLMRKGYTPDSHTIVVNLKNFRDLALFLHDLEDLYDVPIGKAIELYREDKAKVSGR